MSTSTEATSLARMRVRRVCSDAIDARAYADELAAKAKAVGNAEAPRLRAEAYNAWKEAELREKAVRELSTEDILEAAGGRLAESAGGPQLTFDEVLDVVQRVANGDTHADIAADMGRDPNSIYEYMRRWHAGTGRAATRAKQLGIWPSGRKG